MSITTSACYILLLLIRRPSTTTTHSIHLCRIDRVILVGNLFTVIAKKCMHVNANLEFFHIVTIMFVHFFIVFKQGLELFWIASNDRKDHRQPMFACTQY